MHILFGESHATQLVPDDGVEPSSERYQHSVLAVELIRHILVGALGIEPSGIRRGEGYSLLQSPMLLDTHILGSIGWTRTSKTQGRRINSALQYQLCLRWNISLYRLISDVIPTKYNDHKILVTTMWILTTSMKYASVTSAYETYFQEISLD